ncbi:hypothetical protein [Streptosporangium sp. NPDC048865]|uniref:hypothetical protein n=1 Tax=Streptosporangium sp. NPDC048865 TaxID=3155766 RepID=UPI003448E29B
MGRSGQEVALRALGAALDVHAPAAGHGVRTFPDGTPFLWMTVPRAGGAIVFLEERHWICLSEPGRGGATVQLVAGGIDDDPALVVGRIMTVMTPAPRPAGGLARALKAGLLGLAGGAGVALLSALLMAILVAGNGYTSDTTIGVVYVLAALIGVATGLWVSLRWWRMGRGPRDGDSRGQGP